MEGEREYLAENLLNFPNDGIHNFELTFQMSKEHFQKNIKAKEDLDKFTLIIWDFKYFGTLLEKENLILSEMSRDLESVLHLSFFGFYKTALQKIRNAIELLTLYCVIKLKRYNIQDWEELNLFGKWMDGDQEANLLFQKWAEGNEKVSFAKNSKKIFEEDKLKEYDKRFNAKIELGEFYHKACQVVHNQGIATTSLGFNQGFHFMYSEKDLRVVFSYLKRCIILGLPLILLTNRSCFPIYIVICQTFSIIFFS